MAQSHAVGGSIQQTLQQNVDTEPVPLKRKKKDSGAPAGKSVVVLKSRNVTVRNDTVFMPNTIEMAKLKKKERAQFLTNVQISSEMSQQDIKELLISLFPYLGDQRFYCASAVNNRTRLDFHGEPRIWDGRLIKQKIKGNSALYIYTDEGSLGKQDSTSSKQSTLKRPHDQMTQTMQSECRINKDDVSIMTQGGILFQSGTTQNVVSTASQSQSRKPAMHVADGQAEGRNTIPSKSSLLSTLTPQLNNLSIASATSEQERGQLEQTAAGGYDLAHLPLEATTSWQGQGNGAATRVQGIVCNSTDQSKRGSVVSAEVQCARKRESVSYATDACMEHAGTSRSDFEPQSSDSAGERPSDSGIEGSDNLFVDDTVKDIRPDSYSVKGGIGFYIALKEPLPDEVKKGVANFEGVAAVTVDKEDSLFLSGTIPPSQKAGDVMVTVTTDSGHYIGYTWFKYKEEFAVTEVLKRLVKDRTLQSEYFAMLSQELKGGSRASDSKKTDALGQLNVPHLGSSVEIRQKQSVELLQLMVYTAAQTDAQPFINMVFSTTAGQVVFNYYKDRTTLPQDVARANGHEELAQYLQDVHTRLSKDRDTHSCVIDWLELERAVQKQSSVTQDESPRQLDQSDEDENNSSDYFADAETSSCESSNDDIGWSEISENKGTAFSAINTPIALHETEESPAKRNHLKRGVYKERPIVKTSWFRWLLKIIVIILIFLGTTMPETMLLATTSTSCPSAHQYWNGTSCTSGTKCGPAYGGKTNCSEKQDTECQERWPGYDWSNNTSMEPCMERKTVYRSVQRTRSTSLTVLYCCSGWRKAYSSSRECRKAICSQGCHSSHGSCIAPDNCRCLSGWTGNNCAQDVNECAVNNGGCDQLCINTQGSYQCGCNPGYTKTGHQCLDINECLTIVPSPCSCGVSGVPCGANCINLVPSFTCSCAPGFQLRSGGKICDDSNECLTGNGGCQQICNNFQMKFSCGCYRGFRLAVSNASRCEGVESPSPSRIIEIKLLLTEKLAYPDIMKNKEDILELIKKELSRFFGTGIVTEKKSEMNVTKYGAEVFLFINAADIDESRLQELMIKGIVIEYRGEKMHFTGTLMKEAPPSVSDPTKDDSGEFKGQEDSEKLPWKVPVIIGGTVVIVNITLLVGLVLCCKIRKTRKSKPSSAPTSCQFDNPTYETNKNPPETKEDDYYSSIQPDNDPRYAEGEKYPGIQENEYVSLDDYSIYVNANPQPSVARQATLKVNSAYEGK